MAIWNGNNLLIIL